ncbi:hypothetical protein ACPF7Z_00385 [Halomonas sp. GXIMD04776]|uniref:hypothetical protein n=1 Tax=Halomonas sp. GXIMD04776 TaxID=3415605 RepID=UPI003C8CD32B
MMQGRFVLSNGHGPMLHYSQLHLTVYARARAPELVARPTSTPWACCIGTAPALPLKPCQILDEKRRGESRHVRWCGLRYPEHKGGGDRCREGHHPGRGESSPSFDRGRQRSP